MSDTTLPIGSLFAERFRVLRFVARGGFGAVYEARHEVLDVPVALKVLRPEMKTRVGGSARSAEFIAEARTLARLRHTHIVSVLDAGVTAPDDLPWMALEWCEGTTLAEMIEKREIATPLDAARAWALLRPAVEAVAHAHEAQIAHRDIKPANIMIVRDGSRLVPRVVDFGLAKMIEGVAPGGLTASEAGARMTPAYAAPEQVRGEMTGPWTDVHALALVYVELVTGRRAYERGSALLSAIDERRPTPRAFQFDVGPRLEEALAAALALAPADRTRDAGELLRAIDGALGPAPRPQATAHGGDAVDAVDAPAIAHARSLATPINALVEAGAEPSRTRLYVLLAVITAIIVGVVIALAVALSSPKPHHKKHSHGDTKGSPAPSDS